MWKYNEGKYNHPLKTEILKHYKNYQSFADDCLIDVSTVKNVIAGRTKRLHPYTLNTMADRLNIPTPTLIMWCNTKGTLR